MLDKTLILIPAYKPDDRLPAYAAELHAAGAAAVVVVDDGSGEEFGPVFDAAEAAGATVLRYTPNRGKGYALRTGLTYAKENLPECGIIVTADADGQHRAADVLRMVEKQAEYGDGLLLGSRDFSQADVPFKSRAGNRITSVVFRLFYGTWVSDTQTGLRAFSRDLLDLMISVPGDRYEYEMKVLIACAENGIPMRPLTIETVYENNNEGSHFRPFRDSARIYQVILSSFLKFAASSILSFCVDYLCYLLINLLLEKYVPALNGSFNILFFHFVGHILVATALARIISGTFNFTLNRRVVFKQGTKGKCFKRFLCVFFLNMFLSAALVSMLHLFLGVNENVIKIPVDVCLFMLSYTLQKRWVFKAEE